MTNQSTRRAIVARLVPILKDEEAAYRRWLESTRHLLNLTRQRSVERRFVKRIQALKIVIHMLDKERNWSDEEPSFIVKRPKIEKGDKFKDD